MIKTSMKKLFAFLVWLFSFWTWKDFFLCWLGSATSHPASEESVEHLIPQDEQQKSEFAHFLSSLPGDGRHCRRLYFYGDSKVRIIFEDFDFTSIRGIGVETNFHEFLEAVASLDAEFCEELSISCWGDGSCEDLEAFADAFRRSGKRFRKLNFECHFVSVVRFAICVSSVLGNHAIEHLSLVFEGLKEEVGKELAAKFMAFFVVPHNLRILKSFRMWVPKLGGEGMEQLMKPFQAPPYGLENLDVGFITLDVQLEHISAMLVSSTSLKSLAVYKIPLEAPKAFVKGYNSIAIALCTNQSLEAFICEISSSKELKVLLGPLIPKKNNLQCNTTLIKLGLRESIGGKEGIESLVDMLICNTTLLELDLSYVDDLSSHDIQGIENVLTILEALKANKSLKRIGFQGCTAVHGYKVLGSMMDLLLENQNIEDIGLWNTGLEKSKDVDYISSTLSRRKKMKLWGVVQGMATTNPTSGRVFLCGNPYAGKTRLRLSMKMLPEFQQKGGNLYRLPLKSRIRNMFKAPMKEMLLARTRGIEVESVRCNGISITIWDLAGQTDYHHFHELMMPDLSSDGNSSMFLLVCNPLKQLNFLETKSIYEIKLELEYWLRFIASNTRRSLSYRPHVSIIMTHFDYWTHNHAFAACIEDEILQLKYQFQEVLEFDEDKSIFKVNGRDESDIRGVFDFIKFHFKQLLRRLPKTLSACEEVQLLLAAWNADKSKPLLLKWEEFCEGMCKEVKELNDVDHELAKKKREFVAISLNDGGHIIYNEKEGLVITNPHWFCHDIIGQFLHQCTLMDCESETILANGVISIEHMKHLILNLLTSEGNLEKKFDDILGMMIKLHICFEYDASHIEIPLILKDEQESLTWSTNDESTSLKYVGRRLACKDRIQTMLTFGFFRRLQVSFFKMLQNKNAQDTYKVFQGIIKFIIGGIEVVLQFHEGDIDILLQSHQCPNKMLEFLENGIVMHIKHLQEDPTLGCPGVRLIEYILRPACVQRLVHAKDRKKQCIQVKDLEAEVIEIGVDAIHKWKSCEGLNIGYDKVSTLLGDLAWKDLLERRFCDLLYYHKRIQSLGTMNQDDYSNSNYRERMSKLHNMVHVIRNLEDNIKNMQGKLLLEVCSRIDDLMAFSLEMQNSQIPKLVYLCEFGKNKLLTKFVPNLHGIQLHLMCESIYGFHVIPNQKGCVVSFGIEYTRRFLTMIAWSYKIASLLTNIGAHIACGIDSIVPNFNDGGTSTALILDKYDFWDYQIPNTTLESLPSDIKKYSRISIEDQFEAQNWLQEFLEPKCQNESDFYEQFRLKKVRYTIARGSTAWICDKCILLHHNYIDDLK